MEPKSKDTKLSPLGVAASAALIGMVLGNDDILSEILLRLGFTSCLVRAAVVCKQWYRIASAPGFLSRFRALHPPRLLGFYDNELLRFVPRPHPPEVASVVRRCSSLRIGYSVDLIFDCRNGRVILSLLDNTGEEEETFLYAICSSLYPERGLTFFPWPENPDEEEEEDDDEEEEEKEGDYDDEEEEGEYDNEEEGEYNQDEEEGEYDQDEEEEEEEEEGEEEEGEYDEEEEEEEEEEEGDDDDDVDNALQWSVFDQGLLLPEDGGDGLSCTSVTLTRSVRGIKAHVCDLQAGNWNQVRTSEVVLWADLPERLLECRNFGLLAYGKVYRICMANHILGVDLASTSLFLIKLPEGVNHRTYAANIGLSRAKVPGFNLIHVSEDFQLSVWIYRTDGGPGNNWELLDTFCLRQAFGHLMTWFSGQVYFSINNVGDNAEFVLFEIAQQLFYLDVSSRAVEKVYHGTQSHGCPFDVCPLVMVWPPTFPELKNNSHGQVA